MKNLNVALVQTDVDVGDIKSNVEKGVNLIIEASKLGANLVLLPELFTTGYNVPLYGLNFFELAEKKDGESVNTFRQIAKECNVYLYFGFPEIRNIPGVVYNSSAFVGPDGGLIGTYAKTHLFGNERRYFAKGNEIVTFDTDFGKVGPNICYDIGFPEIGRMHALMGAEILLCISAWCLEDRDIWVNNCVARATDNLLFIAACNRIGMEKDLHLIGKSMIVAPRGHIVKQSEEDVEDILFHTIDLDMIKSARNNCLYLYDRRPELYGGLSEAVKN